MIGIVTNSSSLRFSIGLSGKLKNIFGGVEIGVRNKVQKAEFNRSNSRESTDLSRSHDLRQSDTNLAHFEINLNKIAQNLILE